MAQFLVIQLARFGDIVQTKRLVLTLVTRGTVHLCVDRSLADLARIVYPPACGVEVLTLHAHGQPDSAGLAHNLALFRHLAAQSFEEVYCLNHSGLNRAIARLFDPAQVRGYVMHGEQPVHDPWVRMAFGWTQERRHAPLNLVDFWAYFAPKPVSPAVVNPPAIGQGKGLGVVLAGREQRRSLPPTVLAQVVHTAFESMGGVPVYVLGTNAEKGVARQLLRALPGNMLDKVYNLAGQTDWQGLAEAVTGLDALVSPDTGTMHLAAHLGVPVRAFFLSSAWCFETGPYGAGHTVWQACTECVPCLESAPCAIHTACGGAFQSTAFLRSVAARMNPQRTSSAWLTAGQEVLPHMLVLNSILDDLGSFWQGDTHEDAQSAERQALRAVVAEHVLAGHAAQTGQESQTGQNGQTGQTADPPPASAHLAEAAQHLYTEAQWMLTPRHSIFAEDNEDAPYAS